jgi:hypothetical protein
VFLFWHCLSFSVHFIAQIPSPLLGVYVANSGGTVSVIVTATNPIVATVQDRILSLEDVGSSVLDLLMKLSGRGVETPKA